MLKSSIHDIRTATIEKDDHKDYIVNQLSSIMFFANKAKA